MGRERRGRYLVAAGWILEVKGGHFVGYSVAIEGEPERGPAHGLTERLHLATSDAVASIPAQNRVSE